MNKRLILLPILLLGCFNVTSCNAEDGDINEWVGEYKWGANREEKWHHFITGEKKKQSETSYWWEDYRYPFVIKQDKTWFQHNSDKIETSGYSGKVKCYKDHLCFTDMPSNYHVNVKFNFKHNTDTQGAWIRYYYDESVDRHDLDYDYTIRTIYLKLIK
ncbi:MAG: hypothetical protein MJ207_04150 [Bacilli bacterium]|nr:hypothetical protein [Bacilli bacterium]